MATEAQAAANAGQESTSTTEARDDCAITRQSVAISIPILDNDGDHAPSLLRLSAVDGLKFTADGKAVYMPTDQRSEVNFQYLAEDHGRFGNLAKVFVLISGREPLSEVVGHGVDPIRLANACSHGEALEKGVIYTPGETLHWLGPAHHVTVAVDQFVGETLALDDPSLHPWKAITVDGGLDLFDPNGVIFLKDLTNSSNITFKLLDPSLGMRTIPFEAEALLQRGTLEAPEHPQQQPTKPAEIADNRTVSFHTLPGQETHLDLLPKTEFPRCGEQKCLVYAYNGAAYVVHGTDHAQSLQLWPDDLQFAGPLLAANSADAGAGAAVESAFGTYWLEHHPTASVVVLDHFFEHPGGPNPPELSVGESQFVSANTLWNLRHPVDLPGFEGHGPVYLIAESAFPHGIEPGAGPEHGGGAGFTPYGTGGIGEGLTPLLALPPTELPPRELPHESHRKVIEGNHGPVGEDDHGSLVQVGGPPVSINVLANDHDPDGDKLTIVIPGSPAHPTSTPLGGSVATEGQHLLYTPPALNEPRVPDKLGRLFDHFTYTIDDGHHHQATAQVTVAVNRAPVAAGDAAQITGDRVVINVLSNDHDPDGDPLTIVALGPGAHATTLTTELGGRATTDGHQVVYTPPGPGDLPVSDHFTYTIDDGRGGHATAAVDVSSEGIPPHIPPTLAVEPASVTLPVVGDFPFAPGTPLFPPSLLEGQPTDPGSGVDGGNLTLDAARTVTVTFDSETAGYHNSLGYYTVVNHMPTDPHILFPRVDVLNKGASMQISGLPKGTHLGLFLVPDGAGAVDGHTDFAFHKTNGHWELVPSGGGEALPVFFTNSEFNADGQIHALSGLAGDALKIGFEDLTGGGDHDFNDAVVQVSYSQVANPNLGLAATIVDPDSAKMSGASVSSLVSSDSLFLNHHDVLDGSGITVSGEGTNKLTFSGDAPIATYERVLEAVGPVVGSNPTQRSLDFQVVDDTHLASNDAKVTVEVNPVHSTTTVAADALGGAFAGPDHAAVMASLVGTEHTAT